MVFPPREDSGATLALAASVCALSLLAVIVSVCGVISGAMYPELEPVSVVGWEFRLFCNIGARVYLSRYEFFLPNDRSVLAVLLGPGFNRHTSNTGTQ